MGKYPALTGEKPKGNWEIGTGVAEKGARPH